MCDSCGTNLRYISKTIKNNFYWFYTPSDVPGRLENQYPSVLITSTLPYLICFGSFHSALLVLGNTCTHKKESYRRIELLNILPTCAWIYKSVDKLWFLLLEFSIYSDLVDRWRHDICFGWQLCMHIGWQDVKFALISCFMKINVRQFQLIWESKLFCPIF